MKKRLLSALLCLCMVVSLIPGTSVLALEDSPTYKEYTITHYDLTHVQEVLDGVATVTKKGDMISIKLTDDLFGRLSFGEALPSLDGDFILDLNGHTIDPGNLNEAICLDIFFDGTLTITGSGTMKPGRFNCLYSFGIGFDFALEEGYEYYTLTVNGIDQFDAQNTTTKHLPNTDYEVIVTQHGNTSSEDETYTVTFDANGHGTAPSAFREVDAGAIIATPTAPEADGYTFGGWYKEAGCENAWDFENDTVTADTTLYALWTEASSEGEGEGDGDDTPTYEDYMITEYDLAHVQEVLSGVADVSEDGDVIVIKLTSDINGRLHIGENNFSSWAGNFILDLNGKKIETDDTFGEAICLDNNFDGNLTITGNGTIKGGNYQLIYFDWASIHFTVADGFDYFTLKLDGEDYFDEKNTETKSVEWDCLEGDELVIAQGIEDDNGDNGDDGDNDDGYDSETYTITFDANGGTVSTEDAVTEEDGTLASLPTPTRRSYTFNGWFTETTGGEEVTTSTIFEADTTIYAQWTRNGGGNGAATGTTTPSKDPKPEKTEPTTPSIPSTPAAKKSFKDVKATDWFYNDIQYVSENGLMNGVSSEIFSPNAKLTRAMLVTVLYRMENEPATNRSIPFGDIDMSAYYANAVIWAQQNGIVNGVSENKFAPDNNITREQMVAIIHRYAQYKGYDVSIGENTNILSYTDATAISEYATGAMQYACGSGLIKGKSATKLSPKDSTTRAEAATLLRRFIENN